MRLFYAFMVIATLSCSAITQEIDEFDAEEASVEVEPEVRSTIDVPYESPKPLDKAKTYFADHFDNQNEFNKRWIKSQAKKDGIDDEIAKYDGVWSVEAAERDSLEGDKGLVLKSKAKHAAISARLDKPFHFKTNPLIVQYEVVFQDGQECGGAYLKLLTDVPETKKLEQFHDKTPYSIMFGPDKCGNDHKLHFIFKHRNPLNGSVEEKHCKKPKERIDDFFADKLPHLYTLLLHPDNTFEIKVDRKTVNTGSLLEDFTPSVNPAAEIDDPEDKKPEDWDEREKIPDPEAVKPEDWDEDAPAYIPDTSAVMPEGWLEDEPTHIPDASALKPADWDTDMDGEWEPPIIDNPICKDAPGCGKWTPPMINNPAHKGKWHAPLIDNPNYKGKWRPRRIANPHFFEDRDPFRMQPIGAVGFELWSMSKDILFDNLIITDSVTVSEHWASETFDKKRMKLAKDSITLWGRIMRSINYRTKSWALYFFYCLIPVVLYVWYLCSFYKEESVVERLAALTNDYPILWLAYIILLGIPVIIALYCCFGPSKSKGTEEQKKSDEKKKTDEVTPDSVEPVEQEENEADAEEVEDKEEEIDREKYSDEDDEVEEEEKVEDSNKPEAAGDGTRKRKPRKE